MAILTIQAGSHYDDKQEWPWLLKEPNLVRYVRFHRSCIYSLPYANGEDQQKDVNKLYGISYGGGEDNSARFGWKWNPATDQWDLLAYVHDQKRLNRDAQDNFPIVASIGIEPDQEWSPVVRTEIKRLSNTYLFLARIYDVTTSQTVPHSKLNTLFGVNRGLYFGGDNLSPHTMKLELSPSQIF